MAGQAMQRLGDPLRQVVAAVQELQKAHKVGKLILRKCPISGESYGDRLIETAAGKHGINPSTARQYRVFANPKRGYTDNELAELCHLCRTHRRSIGFTVVAKLLTISNKQQRKQFQREAIERGWSVSVLETELFRRFGRRPVGGRRPRIPGTVDELVVDLEKTCIRWRRWHGQLALGSMGKSASMICPPVCGNHLLK